METIATRCWTSAPGCAAIRAFLTIKATVGPLISTPRAARISRFARRSADKTREKRARVRLSLSASPGRTAAGRTRCASRRQRRVRCPPGAPPIHNCAGRGENRTGSPPPGRSPASAAAPAASRSAGRRGAAAPRPCDSLRHERGCRRSCGGWPRPGRHRQLRRRRGAGAARLATASPISPAATVAPPRAVAVSSTEPFTASRSACSEAERLCGGAGSDRGGGGKPIGAGAGLAGRGGVLVEGGARADRRLVKVGMVLSIPGTPSRPQVAACRKSAQLQWIPESAVSQRRSRRGRPDSPRRARSASAAARAGHKSGGSSPRSRCRRTVLRSSSSCRRRGHGVRKATSRFTRRRLGLIDFPALVAGGGRWVVSISRDGRQWQSCWNGVIRRARWRGFWA